MDATRARRDEVEATRAFAEHYFRRWDDARHESLATRALARASADVRAMSNALLGTNGSGIHDDISRSRDAALRARWTRWIAYVSLRKTCLLYTSPSPRDRQKSRMPSSA